MQIPQELQHPPLQLDDASAAGSFRLGKTPASTHFLERPRDAHGAALPVDVLPLQGEVLAGACGRGERNREDWAVRSFHRGLYKQPRLVRRQHPQLATVFVAAAGHRWLDPWLRAAIESPAAWPNVKRSAHSGRFARTAHARPFPGTHLECPAHRLPIASFLPRLDEMYRPSKLW